MSKALDLHTESNAKAFLASQAKKKNDFVEFLKLTKEAFALEKKAAMMLKDSLKSEPTRAVLFRSAATLAVDAGEYSEAIKLISFALIGEPYEEIKSELLEIIERVSDETESLQHSKEDKAYMEFLRDKAINIKVEPKLKYYRKAIAVDSILETLKNVKTSITNYVEVSFKKHFLEHDFNDFDRALDGVIRDYSPLIVNLKFKSFGASIGVDDGVNFKEDSPKILEWKKGLFENYKTEVFEIDYESENSINEIIKKYSDEERNLIYNPIVDSLKDKNKYKVSITDKNFKFIEKTLKPISKSTQERLIPKIKKESESTNKILIQSYALGESSDSFSKKDIFASFEMDYAEFSHLIKEVSFEKEYLVVKEPFPIKVIYKKPHLLIEDTNFDVFTRAESFQDLVKSYNKILINLYKIVNAQNVELSLEQVAIKERLDKTFIFSSGHPPQNP